MICVDGDNRYQCNAGQTQVAVSRRKKERKKVNNELKLFPIKIYDLGVKGEQHPLLANAMETFIQQTFSFW